MTDFLEQKKKKKKALSKHDMSDSAPFHQHFPICFDGERIYFNYLFLIWLQTWHTALHQVLSTYSGKNKNKLYKVTQLLAWKLFLRTSIASDEVNWFQENKNLLKIRVSSVLKAVPGISPRRRWQLASASSGWGGCVRGWVVVGLSGPFSFPKFTNVGVAERTALASGRQAWTRPGAAQPGRGRGRRDPPLFADLSNVLYHCLFWSSTGKQLGLIFFFLLSRGWFNRILR